jgi:hypothetical protein
MWPRIANPGRFAANTFGTWTNGTDWVTVSPLDDDRVRVEWWDGRVQEKSDEKWLDRLDALKDVGWYKRSSL